ncbi:MAG: electron transfer flavoprotein-ubiquinone oxidoreductase [Betaproteobacteria bacterium TMED156]|nr:MAG: electron transfer flavoprotein-ubiquinone oxidoreductase [Betaproteobacteria bacterium TMED156]
MIEEELKYDVLIVGAGPSGLSAAIKIKQIALKEQKSCSVCVIEKSSSVGGHILSGAILDTKSLSELIPDWNEENSPINTPVKTDEFYFFYSKTKAVRIPSFFVPNSFNNKGCHVVSLSDVVKWLGKKAEDLGVEVFTGFPASEVVFDENNAVIGVKTGDFGVNSDGSIGANHVPGISIKARFTIFAEGSRGQLGKLLIKKYKLNKDSSPQTYGLGIKELWEIPSQKSTPGKVLHGLGWPLNNKTYGGSFLYHLEKNRVSIGLIIGLNYSNPWLSPFEEFQKLKTHPKIFEILKGGKRIGYGARSLTAGSLYTLPKLTFPGGALIGCNAGFLNSARIKGSHSAIKSGLLVAEAFFETVRNSKTSTTVSLQNFSEKFKSSWLYDELNSTKNFKGFMNKGLLLGGALTYFEQNILRNKTHLLSKSKQSDFSQLKPFKLFPKKIYGKPDGKITFDKLSSLPFSGVNHEENQPTHLVLKNSDKPFKVNFQVYAAPETRYCPAGVYEYIDESGQPAENYTKYAKLQINAQNCLHCKACDIKDPTQNITWVAPEGGGGPNYEGM